MADLADLGYLDQPHTSAGRVPTAKAFRHFARNAAAGRMFGEEMERLKDELTRRPGLEQRAEHSSHLLTELTHHVGIVAAVPAGSQTLDQIELVWLPESRVLMVVVTHDGLVRNQVAHLTKPVTPEDLAGIRNYVNRNFSGWPLADVRRELGTRLADDRAAYDELLAKLTLLYDQGLLDIGLEPKVFLEGASNLVAQDLHLTRERLRDLLRTLEEKNRLIEMLDQFLTGSSEALHVQVGLGEAHPTLKEFSMVGITVSMASGVEARMAVLGPMRMDYPRAMSAVFHVGQALRNLPQ
jgi:heat-inducible transcriptional repressor